MLRGQQQCPHIFVRRCFKEAARASGEQRSAAGKQVSYPRWLFAARQRVDLYDGTSTRRGSHRRWWHRPEEFVCDVCFTTASEVQQDVASRRHVNIRRPWSIDHKILNLLDKARQKHQPASMRDVARLVAPHLNRKTGLGSPAAALASLALAAMPHNSANSYGAVVAAGRTFPRIDRSPTLFACDRADGSGDCLGSLSAVALRAARYAALAYGPAYTEGFFSSVAANATLRGARFAKYISFTPSAHRQAMKAMFYGQLHHAEDTVDLVASYAVDVPRAASFVVCVDHEWKCIVVAFRGTTSSGDLITDLDPAPMQLSTDSALYGLVSSSQHLPSAQTREVRKVDALTCPAGFLQSVQHAIKECKLQDMVSSLEEQLPEYRTVITGHSLGGIQANLFYVQACATRAQLQRRTVVAFSAAPCVSKGIVDALRSTASAATYHTSGSDAYSSSGSNTAATIRRGEVYNISYGIDAVPRLQLSALRALTKRNTSAITNNMFFLPGHVVWIDHTSDGAAYLVDAVADSNAETSQRWRSLVVAPSAVQHHFLSHISRSMLVP